MISIRRLRVCSYAAVLGVAILLYSTPVRAQDAASTQPPRADDATTAGAAAQAPRGNSDAQLDLAEPDYSIVNLPTTLRLPRFGSSFHLTHRFNENLRRDDFGTQASNLFGLDEGAAISLEYRFGVMRHLQAIVQRTNIGKTFQFSGKYDAVRQSAGTPVSISGIVSVEGDDNFKQNRAPALGGVVSREITDRAALYATPVWVHNSAGGTGLDRDTFYVGFGGRLRLTDTLYVTGEATPRASGYVVNDAEYGFGIEARVGAHVFDLVFSNTQGTTFRQLAHGGNPDSLYFGFNLTRKFF